MTSAFTARACVAQEEMDGTDRSWSIFEPRTWWYGGHVPPGQSAREQPGVDSSA